MKRLLLVSILVLSAFLLQVINAIGLENKEEQKAPTGIVKIILLGDGLTYAMAGLEKAPMDKDVSYKVSRASNANSVIVFERVPYGSFSVWVSMKEPSCGRLIYKEFSFNKPNKAVNIFFSSRTCSFAKYTITR